MWTWVSFEEGSREGKDRPTLVLTVDGARLSVLPMRTRTDQQRRHQVWMDLGAGAWDRSGRSSEVQLNRVLKVSIYDVRRNGSALDADLFDEVLRSGRRYWS